MILWLCGWEFLTLNHHTVNFDGSRHCNIQDKMVLISSLICKFDDHSPCDGSDLTHLICHLILKGNFVKRSCDFFEGISSLYLTTLPNLVAVVIMVVEI